MDFVEAEVEVAEAEVEIEAEEEVVVVDSAVVEAVEEIEVDSKEAEMMISVCFFCVCVDDFTA